VTQLTKQRAQEILKAIRSLNVVVLGDVMLDEFVWGDVTRISPEAPIPVVDVQRESVHLGGAANVLANLVSLGSRASVTGVIGNDRAGEQLRSTLSQITLQNGNLVSDESRPTTLKTRIIAHSQPVVRTDRESRAPVDARIEDMVIERLKADLMRADALVVSDYDKGAVTPRILETVLPIAYERIPVLIDPKLRNFKAYRPATLITPNHFEALRMSNSEEDSDDGLYLAAKRIRADLNCDAVLITARRARHDVVGNGQRSGVREDSCARSLRRDGRGRYRRRRPRCGSRNGASMLEAATFANQAAGIVVGKVGTATVAPEELIATFDD
jgi:D-beta-D-heptose 7-phosphate kinase/D-beta-D-heptose 1-phosphate adenosyltransferase